MDNEQDLPPSTSQDPEAGQVAFIPAGVASESLAAPDVDVRFAQSSPATTTSEGPTTAGPTTAGLIAEEPAIPEVDVEPVTGPVCPWCSKPIVAGATSCPSCGALLIPTNEDEVESIPGVTEIDPRLRDYQPKPQKPQKLVDFLIQFVEEDEVAEAARQRLATKPARRSKKKGPDSNEAPSE